LKSYDREGVVPFIEQTAKNTAPSRSRLFNSRNRLLTASGGPCHTPKMSEHDVLANQKLILENQQTIQENQKVIQKNQTIIKQNQQALPQILKNQEEILALLRK
jgi:hypothetical protein